MTRGSLNKNVGKHAGERKWGQPDARAELPCWVSCFTRECVVAEEGAKAAVGHTSIEVIEAADKGVLDGIHSKFGANDSEERSCGVSKH